VGVVSVFDGVVEEGNFMQRVSAMRVRNSNFSMCGRLGYVAGAVAANLRPFVEGAQTSEDMVCRSEKRKKERKEGRDRI